MKRKSGKIGLVVADDALRAVQKVDGQLVTASVPLGENLKKSVRQLLSSAPFAGKAVAIGLEGQAVLIESLVLPPNTKNPKASCADRLKGDPLFNNDKAMMGLAIDGPPSSDSGTPVIMAAINRERLEQLMQVCRELEMDVETVECSALAVWRAWSGEGLQMRLVRSGNRDMILAGRDERLMFCRIVDAPVSSPELKATLTRAVAAMGADSFEGVVTAGVEDDDREGFARDLDVRVDDAIEAVTDPVALGLAGDGQALIDFTPPEERVMREKRRMRKVSMTMAAACGVLVLVAGVLGGQRTSELEQKKADLEQRLAMLAIAKAELSTLEAELSQEEANDEVISQARPGHRMSTLFDVVASSATNFMTLETVHVQDAEDSRRFKDDSEGPRPRVLEVRLNGLAENNAAVREFAQNLLSTKAFADVKVEASERVLIGVGTEGERFRISAKAETR